MQRYLCIHGHFYQPPRENPGLDEVEVEDSAYPFHDWNERVTAECYAPNTAARILDGSGKILEISNNYSKISFDFGPTLLIWLARHRPDVYAKILEADRVSVREHHGHGNALAQVYNHLIMPLASRRDKETEVIWAIRDFEHRFGRPPEGMWLSETAVDHETLEALSSHGICFTILSPYQAFRVRSIGAEEWLDVRGARIDPTRAYRLFLKSGRWIDLFFYDGPISFSIAFEDSLSNGEALVRKIMGGFSHSRAWPQIVTMATDGESYGHHRKFGEMALSYALHKVQSEPNIRITNFGEYLELHPPEWEVEIYEKTAWSCAHGVGRWKEDCGCRIDHHSGWNQKWRKPLRQGLDALKESLDGLFEREARALLADPWKARDDYIQIVLDRSPESIEKFFQIHGPTLTIPRDRARAIRLLEIQRQGLLMFTSCGWFFDELSGLEPLQVLAYADRAIQLALPFGQDFEPALLEFLSKAKSNIPEWGTGKDIYEELIKPSRVDFKRAAAHWAISAPFENYPKGGSLYSYQYDVLDHQKEAHGSGSISIGRLLMTSKLTFESEEIAFCLLYLGGPDFHCATQGASEVNSFETVKRELFRKFHQGLFSDVLAMMKKDFGDGHWTLKDLFSDERRKVLALVTEENLNRLEESLRDFYKGNQGVMQHLLEEDIELPKVFGFVLEYLLMRDLSRLVQEFASADVLQRMKRILDEARHWDISLDLTSLRKALELELEARFRGEDFEQCRRLLQFSKEWGLHISLWEIQNRFYEFLKSSLKNLGEDSIQALRSLGAELGFHQKFFEPSSVVPVE